MHVAPRTFVRTAAVLACAFVVVAAAGCGGTQPQQDAPAAAPPAPPAPTAAERAAWYQDCWTQFNNKAWDTFRACYADSVESDQVNSGQPPAKGIDAVVAGHKAFTDAFPDVKGTGELILVNRDTILSIYTLNGTHSGPLTGPGDPSIPATGKPIGFLQAHLLQTDSSGTKVAKEEFYSDSGTMLAQLGLNPNSGAARGDERSRRADGRHRRGHASRVEQRRRRARADRGLQQPRREGRGRVQRPRHGAPEHGGAGGPDG